MIALLILQLALAQTPKVAPATAGVDVLNPLYAAGKAKADAIRETTEGRDYLAKGLMSIRLRMQQAGRDCVKKKGLNVEGVFELSEDGKVSAWIPRLLSSESKCFGEKLVTTQIFAPPSAPFYLYVTFFAN